MFVVRPRAKVITKANHNKGNKSFSKAGKSTKQEQENVRSSAIDRVVIGSIIQFDWLTG